MIHRLKIVSGGQTGVGWTGIVEIDQFADTYRTYGLATVRYPVLELEAKVEAFENGLGCSLRAVAARRPREYDR